MSQLFVELYLDEDVSALVAKLLRVRGFTVQTTQQAGRKKTQDDEQLSYAVSQQRALLTHNRDDFARLAQEYFSNRAQALRHHYRGAPPATGNRHAPDGDSQSDDRRRDGESGHLRLNCGGVKPKHAAGRAKLTDGAKCSPNNMH